MGRVSKDKSQERIDRWIIQNLNELKNVVYNGSYTKEVFLSQINGSACHTNLPTAGSRTKLYDKIRRSLQAGTKRVK
jgi:hypothetical protein